MTKYFEIPRRKKLKIFKAPICLKRTASFSFSELDQQKQQKGLISFDLNQNKRFSEESRIGNWKLFCEKNNPHFLPNNKIKNKQVKSLSLIIM